MPGKKCIFFINDHTGHLVRLKNHAAGQTKLSAAYLVECKMVSPLQIRRRTTHFTTVIQRDPKMLAENLTAKAFASSAGGTSWSLQVQAEPVEWH